MRPAERWARASKEQVVLAGPRMVFDAKGEKVRAEKGATVDVVADAVESLEARGIAYREGMQPRPPKRTEALAPGSRNEIPKD